MLAITAISVPRVWSFVQGLRYSQELRSNQNMAIPGASEEALGPFPRLDKRMPTEPGGPPYVTSVSTSGRYFVDQYGRPILVKGDSPWSLMTRLSPAQAQLWFKDRERQGFNAAIISLIGAEANGGPDNLGRTYDGLLPFSDGDILRWNEPFWARAHDYLRIAADHGITAFLYPIDGWTLGQSFVPKSIDQCRAYGAKVAGHFQDLPNIVWLSGGDYFPSATDTARGTDVDQCIGAMMRGVRGTGDSRPFSVQLGNNKSISTENPFWSVRVDWNFVYTYYPTYRAVLDAYRHRPPIPAVLGESNYEDENNQPDTKPTTDETLRRQVLWALTSGAAGDFMGSQDWQFNDEWERRLTTRAVTQISRLRSLFSQLPWWELVPDINDSFVTSGRGSNVTNDPMDVLDNDYTTAAITPDGHLAVVYVPTTRTISIDRTKLARGAQIAWVDPSSGAKKWVPVTTTFTTPGQNSVGDNDWLLLFTAKATTR